MTRLFLDFESRSPLSLPDVGLDRYVRNPDTRAMMLAYAFGDEPVKLWEAHIHGQFSGELKEAVNDPDVVKIAWNAGFERAVFKHVLKTDIPTEHFLDPMILARHMSMPGYLEEVSKILGLEDTAKMSWGTQKDPGDAQKLINMFCMPTVAGGEETLFGISQPWYCDWDSNPEEWKRFCEYCIRDVEAERAILKKLEAFPLPELEHKSWCLDQLINERGIPIDMDLVRGSTKVAERAKTEIREQMKLISGIENTNANPQILKWLKTQGYEFGALAKPFVKRALAGEGNLSESGRQILELRKQSSKTSDSKLTAIANNVSDDGRIRYQFSFLGAPRTGRQAGHDAQPQNLPTPTPEVKKNLELAIELLTNEDYFGLSMEFSHILDAVTGTLRSAIKAPKGKKLVVSDLGAIENRIGGWFSGCDSISKVFREGRDPYLDFASKMYKILYEVLEAEFKAGDKTKRTKGKPATLGCIFGLSGGEEYETNDGDIVKGGLWGYAHAMGVALSREESHEAVRVFRAAYPEVVNCWYALEEAAIWAIEHLGKPTSKGFVHKKGGQKIEVPLPVTLQCFGKKVLRILLPSGRGLHYIRPKLEESEAFGRIKKGITVEGKDQKTKQWTRIKTYGSKLFENCIQAIARDILFNGMFEAEKRRLPIVMTVHDEIVCEVEESRANALEDLIAAMTASPNWAPDLLLGADGYIADRYRKD